MIIYSFLFRLLFPDISTSKILQKNNNLKPGSTYDVMEKEVKKIAKFRKKIDLSSEYRIPAESLSFNEFLAKHKNDSVD